MNQEIKVTIGCRVTPEKKTELLAKAKEAGFNSFSQYLESLIIEASSESKPKLEYSKLSDEDLKNIENRIASLYRESKETIDDSAVNENELREKFNSELKASLNGDYNKFLKIELEDEHRVLIIELINYLLTNNLAVSPAGALIGIMIPYLKSGKGLFEDDEVTKLFLERYETANQSILESAKNIENDTTK